MKSTKVTFGSHQALFWFWLQHYRALLLASTFEILSLTSKILMKSTKVNSHQALFWFWLQHYRALLLAPTFVNLSVTSRILMKSSGANCGPHQALFCFWLQHYRALLLASTFENLSLTWWNPLRWVPTRPFFDSGCNTTGPYFLLLPLKSSV